MALTFLVLRKREPYMPRPFRVADGNAVGVAALALSGGIILLCMPFSPAALVWPHEWVIVAGWALLGLGFYLWSRNTHAGKPDRILAVQIAATQSA